MMVKDSPSETDCSLVCEPLALGAVYIVGFTSFREQFSFGYSTEWAGPGTNSYTMKHKLCDLLILLCFSSGITVIMDSKPDSNREAEEESNFQAVFANCIAKKIYGTFECVNRGTLSYLGELNNEDILDYEGIKLERAEGQSRDLLDLEYDPKDFSNVVQAAARLMERRNLKWDMSNVYPGLQMRVGPMLNGNGVLEFVVDERFNGYGDRQLGTGEFKDI